MTVPVIQSLLDTDLYKISMHAAVFINFPATKVTYKYTNRSSQFSFTSSSIAWLKEQFHLLKDLKFQNDEIEYMKSELPYLPSEYMDYISDPNWKLDPDTQINFQSHIRKDDKERYDLDIEIKGEWKDTILYEIPILALISESYFKFVDTDWDYSNQIAQSEAKTIKLLSNDIAFSEFGTRRRRSYKTQDLVMQGIMNATKSNSIPKGNGKFFQGSSNVAFAKKYGVKPIGTVAHEWIMGIASITKDYIHANKNAMDYWIDTFGKENTGLMLTDTLGTDDFLKWFYPPYSDLYYGVRQDSGDPIKYTEKIATHYHNVLHLPRFSKTICFSDSLNPDTAIAYANAARENGMLSTFGIGTNFSNDFHKKSDPNTQSEPLNIVIKLIEANGNYAIKISDNLGKNMGDVNTVKKVKEELGYVEHNWVGDDESHRWKE